MGYSDCYDHLHVGTFLLWWTTKNTLRARENSFKLSFRQTFERIGKDIMTGDVPLQKVRMHRAYIELLRRVFPKEYDAFSPAEGRPEKENKTTPWQRK